LIAARKIKEDLGMVRPALLAAVFVCLICPGSQGQPATPAWHLVYTPSHRATFAQEWKYTFAHHRSTRWVIALRYPPPLPWSKGVVARAELLTSAGWKPFREATDGSPEKRRLLVIDYPHDDPRLRSGFTVRT
jgi:hypothetical protein